MRGFEGVFLNGTLGSSGPGGGVRSALRLRAFCVGPVDWLPRPFGTSLVDVVDFFTSFLSCLPARTGFRRIHRKSGMLLVAVRRQETPVGGLHGKSTRLQARMIV